MAIENGTYIGAADIYKLFGEAAVTKWATVATNEYASFEDRIQEAIAWAEAEIENCFRGSIYVVPFAVGASGAKTLVYWMATYAGHWLRSARPIDSDAEDFVATMKENVDADIKAYKRGDKRFGGGFVEDGYPTGGICG